MFPFQGTAINSLSVNHLRDIWLNTIGRTGRNLPLVCICTHFTIILPLSKAKPLTQPTFHICLEEMVSNVYLPP